MAWDPAARPADAASTPTNSRPAVSREPQGGAAMEFNYKMREGAVDRGRSTIERGYARTISDQWQYSFRRRAMD
jgi:hypothetical protein